MTAYRVAVYAYRWVEVNAEDEVEAWTKATADSEAWERQGWFVTEDTEIDELEVA